MPPQNLRVTNVSKNQITLAWDVPEQDGGSAITSYIIEKADTKRRTYMTAGNTDEHTLEFTVGKLIEGNEYMFKVYAENAIGMSDPVSLDEPITAKLPFGECLHLCKIYPHQFEMQFILTVFFFFLKSFISMLQIHEERYIFY